MSIVQTGFDIYTSYTDFDWSDFVFHLVFCAKILGPRTGKFTKDIQGNITKVKKELEDHSSGFFLDWDPCHNVWHFAAMYDRHMIDSMEIFFLFDNCSMDW